MHIYQSLGDYITAKIAPALADLDTPATSDQLHAIARDMTIWHTTYTPTGDINLNHTGYIEDTAKDFWDTAWNHLYTEGDK